MPILANTVATRNSRVRHTTLERLVQDGSPASAAERGLIGLAPRPEPVAIVDLGRARQFALACRAAPMSTAVTVKC
jgi:hypothetical protein